jgi:hypothetical protein
MTTNTEAMKQAVLQEAFALGQAEGKGKTARMKLSQLVTARARDGLITVEDTPAIWTNMSNGAAGELKEVGGRDAKETQADKQRASDLKHFVVLGSNKTLDGVELLANATERLAKLRESGAATGRIWELLLAFARKQNKQSEKALSDSEIDRIMEDKSAAERELADMLWGARNTLLKANEGEDYEDIYEACNLIEQRVKELGGTKKQRKKAKADAEKKAAEEKAAKKAAKKAAPAVARQGANKGKSATTA